MAPERGATVQLSVKRDEAVSPGTLWSTMQRCKKTKKTKAPTYSLLEIKKENPTGQAVDSLSLFYTTRDTLCAELQSQPEQRT